MQQKLVQDPFLILVNNPKQSMHIRKCYKIKIYCKKDYQKAFKKLTLFFLTNTIPFNGQNYQKEKEPGTNG